MEETPITRLEKLLELMKRLPEDMALIFEMAENDPEIMKKLMEMSVEVMQLPTKILREMAKIAANRGTA
jgi:hypothetical protein